MSEPVLLWILGVFVTLAIADVVAYVSLKDKISEFNILLVQRVSKVEAFVDLIGEKSAKILHQDDDTFQMDTLLDKYLDRHYELSSAEWTQLMKRCDELEADKTLSMGARLAAAQLNAVCHHKLMMPPTENRWWQEEKKIAQEKDKNA